MLCRLSIKFIFTFILVAVLLSVFVSGQESLVSPLAEYQARAEQIYQDLNAKSFFEMFFSGISNAFSGFLSRFGICICIILIGGIFSIISDSFKTKVNIFETISSCSVLLSFMHPITLCLEQLEDCLSSLCAYMIAFIPTSAYLHSVSGNLVTSTVTTPSVSYAVTALEFISICILLPCIRAMCTIMCINHLCKKANLTSVFNMIKSFSLWAIGLSFTIFSFLISVQSLLTSSADNLAMKSLKFGAARLIPIAGGMISESMRTVIAGAGFIKSITGAGGIVFILYTILPTLFILLGAKLLCFIISCFSSLCSNQSISNFFCSACSLLNIMISLLLGCSVAFIIMFAVFIKTTVAV